MEVRWHLRMSGSPASCVLQRLAEFIFQHALAVIIQPEIPLHRVVIFFAEGTRHALRHRIVKIRHRLASVHFVLVRLNGNARQRRITGDGTGLPDISVAGGKPVLKQLQKIDLAAGLRQHVKILVMDMDIPVDMCRRNVFWKDIVVHKIVGTLRTIFQHGPHGSIGIDVGILPFDVRIRRTGERQLPVDIDQVRLGLAHLRVLGAVEDICFCRLGKSILDQLLFHQILDLLYIGCFPVRNGIHHCIHQRLKLIRGDRFHSGSLVCLADRISDLFYIKRHGHPVPLLDHLRAHRLIPSHS